MVQLVQEGATQFPSKLQVRVSIAKYSISLDGHLLYQGCK
jgi:hypothetical protein